MVTEGARLSLKSVEPIFSFHCGFDRLSSFFSSQTVVSIVVDDVNDNDPVFNQSSYAGHVLENSNVSTSVATVYATDRDRDENGHVSYKITAGNIGNAFEVNNLTGVVTVKGAIDREMVKEFKLTVRAEDGGRPSSRKVSRLLHV